MWCLCVVQSAKNLCSGFSYCLSILQAFYVWNGRGARPEEKRAALDYATSLCGDLDSVDVLDEDDNDDDEMFWAVLGDGDRDYARASHWAWRAGASLCDPQLWKISASSSQQVDYIYRVVGERLMYSSSCTSPPRLTCRWGIASLFWTPCRRCLFSSVPKPGADGKIFNSPSQPQR
jgi:hypothetical protein